MGRGKLSPSLACVMSSDAASPRLPRRSVRASSEESLVPRAPGVGEVRRDQYLALAFWGCCGRHLEEPHSHPGVLEDDVPRPRCAGDSRSLLCYGRGVFWCLSSSLPVLPAPQHLPALAASFPSPSPWGAHRARDQRKCSFAGGLEMELYTSMGPR